MWRHAALAAIVISAAAGCGTDEPEALVTLAMTASVNQAGACPTPPGVSSDCVSRTSATLTFSETAGGSGQLTDVRVRVCRPAECRDMGYNPVGSPTSAPAAEGTIPPRGILEFRFVDPRFHRASDRPDIVTATVVSPRGSYPLTGEFRFAP